MSLHNTLLGFIAIALFIVGCNEPGQQSRSIQPVAFHSADECHICGMMITRFPGPKGEVIEVENQRVRKFCSTAEMLSWWIQPEHRHKNMRLFVHDMSKSEWDMPDDAHLIDASEAFFVPAPEMPAAMGTTLASFSDRQMAEQFALEQQSEVMQLNQLKGWLETQEPVGAMPSHDHH